MRVEIQVQSIHLQWWKKKKEQGTTEIDCEALFKDYGNTTAHGFSVPGQLESPPSPFIANREDAADIDTGKHSYSLELQFSAEVTVRLLIIVHRWLLILFAQTDSLRSSLLKLANMLKDYSPLMTESTEKALEKVIKFGAAFSEVGSQFSHIKTIRILTYFS